MLGGGSKKDETEKEKLKAKELEQKKKGYGGGITVANVCCVGSCFRALRLRPVIARVCCSACLCRHEGISTRCMARACGACCAGVESMHTLSNSDALKITFTLPTPHYDRLSSFQM